MVSSHRISIVAAATLAILSACSAARSPESYSLRYRFQAGQEDRYVFRLIVRTNMRSGGPVTGRGTETFKIERVDPDGSAVITASVKGLKMSSEPPDAVGHDSAYRFTMTPRGEVRPSSKTGPSSGSPFGDPAAFGRMGTLLPDRPVKVGDSWTSKIANPLTGTGSIEVRSSLVLAESIGRTKTLRIHQSFTVPIDSPVLAPATAKPVYFRGTLKVNSTINFAPELGKVVRSSTLGTGSILTMTREKAPQSAAGNRITLDVDVSLELLP